MVSVPGNCVLGWGSSLRGVMDFGVWESVEWKSVEGVSSSVSSSVAASLCGILHIHQMTSHRLVSLAPKQPSSHCYQTLALSHCFFQNQILF